MDAAARKKKRKFCLCLKRRDGGKNQRYESSKVVLGDRFDRWREMMKELGSKTDSAFAKRLLDRYTAKPISLYENRVCINF